MLGRDNSRPVGHSQGVDDREQFMNIVGDMENNENAESLARNLWRCFDKARFRDTLPLLSDNFVVIWPNTQERFVGPKNFIAMNEAYPGPWTGLVDAIGYFKGRHRGFLWFGVVYRQNAS